MVLSKVRHGVSLKRQRDMSLLLDMAVREAGVMKDDIEELMALAIELSVEYNSLLVDPRTNAEVRLLNRLGYLTGLASKIEEKHRVERQLLAQSYGNLLAATGAYDACEIFDPGRKTLEGLDLSRQKLDQNIKDLEHAGLDIGQVFGRSQKTSDAPIISRLDLLTRSEAD